MPRVTVLQNDGTRMCEPLSFDSYGEKNDNSAFVIPSNSNKMTQIRDIMDALRGGNIPLLFDGTMISSSQKVQTDRKSVV